MKTKIAIAVISFAFGLVIGLAESDHSRFLLDLTREGGLHIEYEDDADE